MRKTLLISLIILTAGLASAQTCNPQYQDSTFGAWPDTTTNFATAYVGVPYVQTLDFKAPSDAGDIDPTYSGATISSYKVTAVNGLPTGFTYNCSANNCQYTGGTAGCAELVGTATAGQVGVHPIEIKIEATLSLGPIPIPVPYTFNGYKLVIEEQEDPTAGVSLVAPDQVYIYPNPASTTINVLNASNFKTMEVYSVNGQLIMSNDIQAADEIINIADLKEGIYFLHLINDTTKSVHKFTKK